MMPSNGLMLTYHDFYDGILMIIMLEQFEKDIPEKMQCVFQRENPIVIFAVMKDFSNGMYIQLYTTKCNLFIFHFHFDLHVNYSHLSNYGS